MIRITDYG